MAKLYGSLTELVSVVFREDSQAITFRPNQSTTYTSDRDIQLPPGDAAHVMVSEDGTQTLTNKSIAASGNTITGITNSEIDAAAGIVDTKLATISTAGKVSGGAITSGTIGGSTAINTSRS